MHPKPGESGSPAEAAEAAVTEPADDAVVEPEPEPDPNAVPITIDGRPVVARKGELVIAAAERHGAYIPRFCWHHRMSSVGMCRHVPRRGRQRARHAAHAVVHGHGRRRT